MSPEELARTHSQIIDMKLSGMKELFKSANLETGVKIEAMFNSLELDSSGRVKKSPSNRKIINSAISMIRKKTNSLRPIVFNQYLEAKEQIDRLATDYI